MKTTQQIIGRVAVVAVIVAMAFGCASAPKKPAGSEAVRAKLTALQSDPLLATQAPVETQQAEKAVVLAETSQPDLELAAHRVLIADRKVETARAQAQAKVAESRRTALNEQSDKARLDARTREADRAKADATMARADSAAQTAAADRARTDATTAQQQAAELQRQLEMLKAQPTDRGLVLTLGDTLFATGRAELNAGASANLDRLGSFLGQYPERTAAIEGFTDDVGSEDSNQALSQRRAESVKGYLVNRGVQANRLTTSGRGESMPVADNASMDGRRQNRRVEVIISESARVETTTRNQ